MPFAAALTKPPLVAEVRRQLLAWYRRRRRDLAWRRTRDPYRILVSEVMLQQTRVAVAAPYYERFLAAFPTARSLAKAPEPELLAAWAGLGYYSRARNLQKAARQIVAQGCFPRTLAGIRELPGVGPYTAAAVASIAFNVPAVAVDGNVLRVMSRLMADRGDIASQPVRARLAESAEALLHPARPGDFNQALMELGATVCLPRAPRCAECPVNQWCQGRALGCAGTLPVKRGAPRRRVLEQTLILAERDGSVLLCQRPADSRVMPGFWDLPRPDQLPGVRLGPRLGKIRHAITVTDYHVSVVSGRVTTAPAGCRWVNRACLAGIPLSSIARKALKIHDKQAG